jgi:hypothetical protein
VGVDNARVPLTASAQVVIDNIRASHQYVGGLTPLGHHRSRGLAFDSRSRLYVQVQHSLFLSILFSTHEITD